MKQTIKVKVWKHVLMSMVMYVSLAAILFGSGAGLVWLKFSNAELYEKKADLEVQIQILEAREVDLQAEAERLQNPTQLPR